MAYICMRLRTIKSIINICSENSFKKTKFWTGLWVMIFWDLETAWFLFFFFHSILYSFKMFEALCKHKFDNIWWKKNVISFYYLKRLLEPILIFLWCIKIWNRWTWRSYAFFYSIRFLNSCSKQTSFSQLLFQKKKIH